MKPMERMHEQKQQCFRNQHGAALVASA